MLNDDADRAYKKRLAEFERLTKTATRAVTPDLLVQSKSSFFELRDETEPNDGNPGPIHVVKHGWHYESDCWPECPGSEATKT